MGSVLTPMAATLVPVTPDTMEMVSFVCSFTLILRNHLISEFSAGRRICGTSDNCDVNAICSEIGDRFDCDCLPGFSGSGVACYGTTDE